MQLLEHRKHPLHYFAMVQDSPESDPYMVKMPREHNGWEKRTTLKGEVLTTQYKPVKATVQMPMSEYMGVPADE